MNSIPQPPAENLEPTKSQQPQPNVGANPNSVPSANTNFHGGVVFNQPANNPQGAGAPATASLYVGDLHTDISEAQIFDKFSPVGTVISIRVCRDMVSRKSLGYAYVNFSNRSEAEKAIETLNFEDFKGRQMRIMWSQRDPSLRKSGVGNVFIKNIDKKITVREIYDTFSAFGEILSCKIACDDTGASKGYGFVHFKTQESADSAIGTLHNMIIYERKVHVCKFKPKVERSKTDGGDAKFNNIFVKNFGEDMTEDKLRELFAQFGNITSLKMEFTDEGNSKGFGFVCYDSFDAAKKAVDEMQDKEIAGGKKLYVGRAMKKSERLELLRKSLEKKKNDRAQKFAPGVNLYVKNLDDSVSDETLRSAFSPFGNITSAKVMMDAASGRSKGFGFVCFQYSEEAAKAVTDMSGKYVGSKPLYVALAQRKEERRQQLANQYMQRQINRNAFPGNTPMFSQMPSLYNQAAFPNSQMFLNRPSIMGVPQMTTNQRGRMPGQNAPMSMGAGAGQSMRAGLGMPHHQAFNPSMMNRQPNPLMRAFNPSMMQMAPNMVGQQGAGMAQRMPGSMMNAGSNPNTRMIRPQQNFMPQRATMGAGPQMRPQMMGAPQQSQHPDNIDDDILNKQNFEALSEEAKRNALGETLFRIVSTQTAIENAPKVTGMLLETDLNELRNMMDHHSKSPQGSRLIGQIDKALNLLQAKSASNVNAGGDGPIVGGSS